MKNYAALFMSLLIFSGCGDGINTPIDNIEDKDISTNEIAKKSSDDLSKLSDSEKLAVAIKSGRSYESAGENLREKDEVFTPNTLQSCIDGGTMEMIMDLDANLSKDDTQEMTILFQDCNQDGEIIDGSMKIITMGENSRTEFSENFKVIGKDFSFYMIGSGSVDSRIEEDYEISTINLEMDIDGLVHGGQDLVYKSRELINGGYEEYPVSGEEKIGDSTYFSVDSSYDASLTPFISDKNSNLLSGKFKYIDENGHQVELEVTRKNEISVKVDENGNNQFSNNEITVVSL